MEYIKFNLYLVITVQNARICILILFSGDISMNMENGRVCLDRSVVLSGFSTLYILNDEHLYPERNLVDIENKCRLVYHIFKVAGGCTL